MKIVVAIILIFIKELQILLKKIAEIAKKFEFACMLEKKNIQNKAQNILLILYNNNI